MNLLADESVASVIVERLRADGHTLAAIREAAPGIPDAQVVSEADRTQSVLITEDKDFGELVYRGGVTHHGVVLLRLAGLSRALRADLVSQAFRDHGHEFVGAFTVITSTGIRIRPPSPPPSQSPP